MEEAQSYSSPQSLHSHTQGLFLTPLCPSVCFLKCHYLVPKNGTIYILEISFLPTPSFPTLKKCLGKSKKGHKGKLGWLLDSIT